MTDPSTLKLAQPGKDAFVFEGYAAPVILEPSNTGGMIRIYHERPERERADGKGRFRMSRTIPIEQARSQFGYPGVDSSD